MVDEIIKSPINNRVITFNTGVQGHKQMTRWIKLCNLEQIKYKLTTVQFEKLYSLYESDDENCNTLGEELLKVFLNKKNE